MKRAQWYAAIGRSARDTAFGMLTGAFWMAIVAYLIVGSEMPGTLLDIAPSIALFLPAYFGIVLALNVARTKGDLP